jgi:hypothetical protein
MPKGGQNKKIDACVCVKFRQHGLILTCTFTLPCSCATASMLQMAFDQPQAQPKACDNTALADDPRLP